MKKKVLVIIIVIMTLAIIGVTILFKNGILAKAEYSSEYNRTFGEFTAKTASELLKHSQKNTCYSPVSLFAALTLVAENTEGDTQEEIIELFGVEDIEQLEQYYNKMLEEGVMVEAEDEKTPIVLCNSLWILEDYLEDDSSKVISRSVEKTGSEIFVCDEILPEEINEWVSKKTNSQITNIADSYEEMSSALINTLYYNSAWKNPFIEIGKDIFILNDGSKESVEFIECEVELMKYAELEKYTMVSAPMDDGEMVFVYPNKDTDLEDIVNEKQLNIILSSITNGDMTEGYVTLSLPKFTIEDGYEDSIEKILKSLGVEQVYNEDSQWSLSEKLNGEVFAIKQKSKIVVNDKGIEASAVTKAATYLSAKENTADVEISLNRPFMYILMKDGVPLFIGTVYNPVE